MPCLRSRLATAGWSTDSVIEVMADFMKNRLRKHHLPYDREVPEYVGGAGNYVIHYNLDPRWFAAFPRMVEPKAFGSNDLLSLNLYSPSSFDRLGVCQDDGLEAG